MVRNPVPKMVRNAVPKMVRNPVPKMVPNPVHQWSKPLFTNGPNPCSPMVRNPVHQWSQMGFTNAPNRVPNFRGRRELGAFHMHLFFKLQHSTFQSCMRKFAWPGGRLTLACAPASGYLDFRFGCSHRQAAQNQKKQSRRGKLAVFCSWAPF